MSTLYNKKSSGVECLEIKNFLVIDSAKIHIKEFNVIIGPQASGKSVITKLIYFFRNFLDANVQEKFFNNEISSDSIKAEIEDNFNKWFPPQSWRIEDSFSITYKNNDTCFTIKRRKSGKTVKISFSENIEKYLSELNAFRNSQKEQISLYPMWWEAREIAIKYKLGNVLSSDLFIPASRSVFAHVQGNVFSLLAENVGFDPFMVRFGRVFEENVIYAGRWKNDDKKRMELSKRLKSLANKVLLGEHVYENKKHWIKMKHAKVELINASSGQQESLPMLEILVNAMGRGFYFIEEPEAHLFPEAQRNVVKILVLLKQDLGNGFFITTHSPYVMTAINNSLMGYNVIKKKGVSIQSKVDAILGDNMAIEFKDVAAYSIQDGVAHDILDYELELINADAIDSVSNIFGDEFDKLLELLN